MTTTLDKNITQQKAHADSTGLMGLLNDFESATRQALAGDALLTQLYDLPLDHELLYLHRDISITTGDLAGEYVPTTNTIGLVLTNNQRQPVSLASITPNSGLKPFITDTSRPCAFAIGTGAHHWAVASLEDGIALYNQLSIYQGLDVTVLVSINPWQFVEMVKHFAQVQTVTVTTTIDQKDKLLKPLAGANVQALITVYELPMLFSNGLSLDDVMQAPENVIQNLQVNEWPKPESLADDPSKPTPYPIDAWAGLLRKVVESIAYHGQVPLAMAGQCVLGALSHIGQAFIDAPIGHGHMPTSLYLITEGESGSGKSTAMGLSHYEIKAYEREQYQDYLKALDEWEADRAVLKGPELKDFLANEPRPHNPITMFGDATIEPILDKFINGEMSNASWTTDEAAQFFNGHTMKGDTAGNALSALTTLYSDGSVNRLRSQKSQHANPRSQAYDVRMTLLLMGQRVVLEQALTDPMMNGQGFLARSLIACPESLQGQRVWNDLKRSQQSPYDDHALIAYWSRCRSLLDPMPANNPQSGNAPKGRIKMRWHDAQAKQAFTDCMQSIENRQAKGQSLEYLKAYASRMAENASRIASLMAFFDERRTITTDDITRAFMLVEYSTSERLRYLDASPTGEQNDSEKLSYWLVDKVKGRNPPILNKSFVSQNAPNALRGKKLNALLEDLESVGHIRLESEGRRRLVSINPNLIMS